MCSQSWVTPEKFPHAIVLISLLLVQPSVMAQTVATIGVNVPGLSQSSAALDPDVSGAAGTSTYAEFVNGSFGVFDKATGAIDSQSSDQAFWENAGISSTVIASGTSNPRLIYDPNSQRWFATEITTSTPANSVLLAVSTGSDPSPTKGNWTALSFSSAAAGSSDPYGSFPTLGLDANGVYIATDNCTSSSPDAAGNSSSSLFSIPKSDLVAPTPSLTHMSASYGTANNYETVGYILQPVIDLSPTKGSAVVISDNVDALGAINRFNVIGTTAANATLSTLQTTSLQPYAYAPSPRQPNGSGNFNNVKPGLLIPDDRYASSVYQVGNLIYSVHTVGLPADSPAPASDSLQWSVLRAVNDNTTVLVQQGFITDPNSSYDYFNPSICANAAGDVVIGYNRSGPGTNGMIASLVSVGNSTGGTISFQTAIQVSATTVTSFRSSVGESPWGDYSSMSPDPTNSSVFWFAQEIPVPSVNYPTSSDTWGTQITEIDVPEASTFTLTTAASTIALIRRLKRRAPS